MAKRKERIYYPIWVRIRDKRPDSVVLHVQPMDEYTVRRMVQKEKNDDLAFKVECDHAGTAWRLVINVEKINENDVRMSFHLKRYIPLRIL